VGTWRGAWPTAYRRALGVVFLGGLLALSMLVGILTPGPTVALLWHRSAATSAHHGVSTLPSAGLWGDGKTLVTAVPASDARFAIATLGVHCLLNPCAEAQVVAPGQRIYSTQEGVTCITTSGMAVEGHGEHFVYCRVETPNMFTYRFDGAQFDCVGSRLGCHNVMIVDTTNGH
jgi:hypothetical protein